MRGFTAAIMIAALAAAQAAQATDDPGPMLHDTRTGGYRIGAGVVASVSIPLGAVRADARIPRLAVRAGPAVTRATPAATVRSPAWIAPLAEFALLPGHSTTWSLAGQPLAVRSTPAALRDGAAAGSDDAQRNMSTTGKIAIGVGVIALVAAGVYASLLIEASNTRGDE